MAAKLLLRMGMAAASMSIIPAAASAHTGMGSTNGFMHGLGHPISGLDHILAMMMVGVFAWQLGGLALWFVPTAFVCAMALGGLLGFAGFDLPLVETGIAVSVVMLGAVVALGSRRPAPDYRGNGSCWSLCGFHGHAHGAEMPENTGGVAYAAGFMTRLVASCRHRQRPSNRQGQ